MSNKVISAIILLGANSMLYADDNVSQQIQLLNTQIQMQFQKVNASQLKQNKDFNTQIQAQLKQMQTDLQDQIQKMNTQTQNQMKDLQASLQQQISDIQQQALKSKQ